MLTKIAQSVYSALVFELRRGSAGNRQRKKFLRKARRFLLRCGDPDVVAFHSPDAALGQRFLKAENEFFECSLNPSNTPTASK